MNETGNAPVKYPGWYLMSECVVPALQHFVENPDSLPCKTRFNDAMRGFVLSVMSATEFSVDESEPTVVGVPDNETARLLALDCGLKVFSEYPWDLIWEAHKAKMTPPTEEELERQRKRRMPTFTLRGTPVDFPRNSASPVREEAETPKTDPPRIWLYGTFRRVFTFHLREMSEQARSDGNTYCFFMIETVLAFKRDAKLCRDLHSLLGKLFTAFFYPKEGADSMLVENPIYTVHKLLWLEGGNTPGELSRQLLSGEYPVELALKRVLTAKPEDIARYTERLVPEGPPGPSDPRARFESFVRSTGVLEVIVQRLVEFLSLPPGERPGKKTSPYPDEISEWLRVHGQELEQHCRKLNSNKRMGEQGLKKFLATHFGIHLSPASVRTYLLN